MYFFQYSCITFTIYTIKQYTKVMHSFRKYLISQNQDDVSLSENSMGPKHPQYTSISNDQRQRMLGLSDRYVDEEEMSEFEKNYLVL